MPVVLSPQQVTETLTVGQEVWYNGHRAFIEKQCTVFRGTGPQYIIKQGRDDDGYPKFFSVRASQLSSQRPR